MSIYCDGNILVNLPELPHKLITLSCKDNNIAIFPTLPESIEYLYFDNNHITYIPALPNIRYSTYENNPIKLIHYTTRAMVDNTIYWDSESVQCDEVHKNTILAIEYLANIDLLDEEHFIDNPNIPQFVIDFVDSEYDNGSYSMAFKDIFMAVYTRFIELEVGFEPLIQNVQDAQDSCVDGKIIQIIASLTGLDPHINITISESEYIGGLISYRLGTGVSKEQIVEELKERGYGDKIIQEWAEFID